MYSIFVMRASRRGCWSRSLCSSNHAASVLKSNDKVGSNGNWGIWASLAGVAAAAWFGATKLQQDEEWKAKVPEQVATEICRAKDKVDATVLSFYQVVTEMWEKTQEENANGILEENKGHIWSPQATILSPVQSTGLFLTIHLNPDESDEQIAKCVAIAAKTVFRIARKEQQNNGPAKIAIGFSERAWTTVQSEIPGGLPLDRFELKTRKGDQGTLPATGGDIFVHMKSSSRGQCFETAKAVLESLPMQAIYDAEDVYGFKSGDNQDLFGYTLHDVDKDSEKKKIESSVIPTTGGSYLLAQQWRHRLYDFSDLSRADQDKVFGVSKDTGLTLGLDTTCELEPETFRKALEDGLPTTSHVARMTGFDQNEKKLSIVRQSMPCGALAPGPVGAENIHEPGLFFLGYSNNPAVFHYMLDRMIGSSSRKGKSLGESDSLMRFSQCIRGQLFYVPSEIQLEALAKRA